MTRRRNLAIGAAAALVAVTFLAWYIGSPWWTLWRMREAARAGDWKTLASYVDLDTMNRGAAAKARAYWKRSIAIVSPTTEGGRRFIAYMKRRMANADTEAPVRLGDLRPSLSEMPMAIEAVGRFRSRPYVVRRGLDAFEVRDRDPSDELGLLLTFRRQGLGWRLVGVRLGQQ